MQACRLAWYTNPAAWYTLLGLGVLGISLWVPWLAAERTARVERRADELAGVLLQILVRSDQLQGAAATDTLLARFLRAAAAAGVPTGDLEPVEPTPSGLLILLQNKHYALHVAESPPEANQLASDEAIASYEVVAWPLSSVGPGHSVFFYPDNAARAFTRNLGGGFTGLDDRRPPPGACHRPRRVGPGSERFYRSHDDKRWIVY